MANCRVCYFVMCRFSNPDGPSNREVKLTLSFASDDAFELCNSVWQSNRQELRSILLRRLEHMYGFGVVSINEKKTSYEAGHCSGPPSPNDIKVPELYTAAGWIVPVIRDKESDDRPSTLMFATRAEAEAFATSTNGRAGDVLPVPMMKPGFRFN
eukprot:TRINITY_DN1874_c1_g1_i1.p6 TRINITY_DN1874_c1_g1~~TRINITY_DN1874_c1_g1_i1.p6  ORF type:complete len:155 (-),score=21.34 TRINITY_DN1874_c1_g1_i1:664-1128(-)